MGEYKNFILVIEMEKYIKLGLYVFIFVLGVIGNFFVFFVLWLKKWKLVNDIFIFNLLMFDLIFMLLFLLVNVFFLGGVDFLMMFCKLIYFFMIVIFNVSIFILMFMVVYCCCVIINFLKLEMCYRNVNLWIIVIWIVGFLFLFLFIIVVEIEENGGCIESWELD